MKSIYFSGKEALLAWAATFVIGVLISAFISFLPFTANIPFTDIAAFGVVVSGVICLTNIFLLRRYARFSYSNSKVRILSHFAITTVSGIVVVVALSWIFSYIFGYISFFKTLALAACLGFPAVVINEALIIFHFLVQWKESLVYAEALKQDMIRTQLESLKHQVSPHFFFNSLNSLTVVIEEDPEEAVRYVHHIAHMYRYLLQSKETNVVPLSQELKFAETYIYLQKMRFGKSLDMVISINEEDKKTLIPPLTLYILLENAIKHNIITKSKPLHINVFIQDGKLQICNNIQMRPKPEEKANVGLKNVRSSYESISVLPMQISQDNENFIVALPLISELSQTA